MSSYHIATKDEPDKRRAARPDNAARAGLGVREAPIGGAGNQAMVKRLAGEHQKKSQALASAANASRFQEASVLLKEVGNEWAKVKDKHIRNEDTMRLLVDYRKAFVDGLIAEIKQEPRFAGIGTRAAGSTALSSDYDLTFLGDGAADAVAEFNKRFARRFGAESGVVFDTNVYAQDVLPGRRPSKEAPDEATLLGSPDPARAVDAHLDTTLQDVASLVKVRKNMTREGWETFTSRIVSAYRGDRALQAEAAARFAQAQTTYLRVYVAGIMRKLEENPEVMAQHVAPLRAKGLMDTAIVEELATTAPGIAASNRLYEAKLAEAATLEARRKEFVQGTPEWKQATVDLRNAMSQAMLFANEPYFSAGTLFHVVGNIQIGWGLDLDASKLMQSMNENYGDVRKELHHLHGKSYEEVAVKTSKYAFRLLDAAVALRRSGVTTAIDPGPIHVTMREVLKIRQGEKGALARDGVVAALTAHGMSDAAGFKKKLSKLVTEVNIAARRADGEGEGGNQAT